MHQFAGQAGGRLSVSSFSRHVNGFAATPFGVLASLRLPPPLIPPRCNALLLQPTQQSLKFTSFP
jgi:hypothetical protein